MAEHHGSKESSEHRAWSNMKQRCYNPNTPYYDCYGGRGITVCDRWRHSFQAFYDDMGPRPPDSAGYSGRRAEYSVERRDVNGNYEPGNCYWATQIEQGSNRRNNRRVELKDERMTVAELGRRSGNSVRTIINRLGAGQSPEEANRPPIDVYTLNDESHTLKEWSDKTGLAYSTIYARLRLGWTLERVLTIPSRTPNRKRGPRQE